ncbi:MAG: glutamate synthase subunit alpha, partial [Thermomicrobiales bacterium]
MFSASRPVDRTTPLWSSTYERDSCGVGLVVDIAGRPSHEIVSRALAGLVNLTHRGGVGADSRTGDGAGVLTQIPLGIFAEELAAAGAGEVAPGELGVMMLFLPVDEAAAATSRTALEDGLRSRGLEPLAWRVVPTDITALGEQAIASMPRIEQLLTLRPAGMDEETFERELFLARKAAVRATQAAGIWDFFVASSSARTIIYKAFCLPRDLHLF